MGLDLSDADVAAVAGGTAFAACIHAGQGMAGQGGASGSRMMHQPQQPSGSGLARCIGYRMRGLHDLDAAARNGVLIKTPDEDRNGNGQLDPGEDVDEALQLGERPGARVWTGRPPGDRLHALMAVSGRPTVLHAASLGAVRCNKSC